MKQHTIHTNTHMSTHCVHKYLWACIPTHVRISPRHTDAHTYHLSQPDTQFLSHIFTQTHSNINTYKHSHTNIRIQRHNHTVTHMFIYIHMVTLLRDTLTQMHIFALMFMHSYTQIHALCRHISTDMDTHACRLSLPVAHTYCLSHKPTHTHILSQTHMCMHTSTDSFRQMYAHTCCLSQTHTHTYFTQQTRAVPQEPCGPSAPYSHCQLHSYSHALD